MLKVRQTGLLGKPVNEIIQRFFGKLDRWPLEPDRLNFTQSQIQAICERMAATGECLWHAQSVVMGTACHCAKCSPEGVMHDGRFRQRSRNSNGKGR